MHILPKGFVKIRRYGIYNHTTKRNLDLEFTTGEKRNLELKRLERYKETTVEKTLRLTGFDISLCPRCRKGKMQIINTLPRARSPTFLF